MKKLAGYGLKTPPHNIVHSALIGTLIASSLYNKLRNPQFSAIQLLNTLY